MTPPDEALRRELRGLLQGGGAHLTLDAALAGLPPEHRDRRAAGLRSPWELLEHLRIAQADLLAYTRDQSHPSPVWPDGYWPDPAAYDEAAWSRTLSGFRRDLDAWLEWLDDPGLDLTAPLPAGAGRTYLRQVLLVADHNAYHLGQLVAVRRALGDGSA